MEEYLSSVERYRRGQLDGIPYDLGDSLDRAIWCALQVYVDYLETVDLERQDVQRAKANIYQSPGPRMLTKRDPWLLEKYMVDLRDEVCGRKPETSSGNRYLTSLRILEALFAPAQHLSGRPVTWEEGEYTARRNFWQAGEDLLEELEESRDAHEGGLGAGTWGRSLTRVAHEAPLLFPERLAPLFALVLVGLGKLVSQSEAARRLNLTPRGVSLRIERDEMRHVRVGNHVFVPVKDIEASNEERLQARGKA